MAFFPRFGCFVKAEGEVDITGSNGGELGEEGGDLFVFLAARGSFFIEGLRGFALVKAHFLEEGFFVPEVLVEVGFSGCSFLDFCGEFFFFLGDASKGLS